MLTSIFKLREFKLRNEFHGSQIQHITPREAAPHLQEVMNCFSQVRNKHWLFCVKLQLVPLVENFVQENPLPESHTPGPPAPTPPLH